MMFGGCGGSDPSGRNDAASSPWVTGADAAVDDIPEPRSDASDSVPSDSGESCSCDSATGGGASKVAWACFCAVESCYRRRESFVGDGDGGKAVAWGNHTVLVTEFAGCNLVLVQAHTYSDFVPPSDYVFDRATGALIGARVWLDDREHMCPFPGTLGWVYGYESGTYPVPSACQVTECLAGTGSCSSRDAI
jgi:hypothetical protein